MRISDWSSDVCSSDLYSQKVMDQLGSVRTMAVREAIVTDPELALDVLLTGLLGQVRGEVYSWQQAVEIKAETNPFHIEDAIIGHSSMRAIDSIRTADLTPVSAAPAVCDNAHSET